MENYRRYATYRKPSWAPPSWLFAPVWSFLYIIIALTYGFVAYEYFKGLLPFEALLPFILNLGFNILYTPIQFKLGSFRLALADILLVLFTLVWALVAVVPYLHAVAYANIPYLLWVSFATVLQATVTYMNRSHM